MGLCSPSRQTLRQTLVKESFQISLFWFGFCVGFFFLFVCFALQLLNMQSKSMAIHDQEKVLLALR